jgi:uncharacterized repeat protein (TIGR03803 family)
VESSGAGRRSRSKIAQGHSHALLHWHGCCTIRSGTEFPLAPLPKPSTAGDVYEDLEKQSDFYSCDSGAPRCDGNDCWRRSGCRLGEVVLSFNGATGLGPSGLSIDATGNLWGVTFQGGTGDCGTVTVWGCGTVFELTPTSDGWKPKTIYSFQGGQDGAYPTGNLAFDTENNVYGVTGGGGVACQCGTVYKLTPQSGRYKETVIYRFNDTPSHNDGSGPSGGLVMDAAGNFLWHGRRGERLLIRLRNCLQAVSRGWRLDRKHPLQFQRRFPRRP